MIEPSYYYSKKLTSSQLRDAISTFCGWVYLEQNGNFVYSFENILSSFAIPCFQEIWKREFDNNEKIWSTDEQSYWNNSMKKLIFAVYQQCAEHTIKLPTDQIDNLEIDSLLKGLFDVSETPFQLLNDNNDFIGFLRVVKSQDVFKVRDKIICPTKKIDTVYKTANYSSNVWDRDKLSNLTDKELKMLEPGVTIIAHHFRGKTDHLDFRRKMENYRGNELGGFTIISEIAETITEPVLTLEDAKKVTTDITKISKFHSGTIPSDKIYVVGKGKDLFGSQPLPWLTMVNHILSTVGSTKNFPGIFYAANDFIGYSWIGAEKPYYKEIFLDMPSFQRKRLNIYLLKDRPVGWTEELSKDEMIWLLSFAKSDKPYIISDRNLKKEWIPIYDEHSALPPWWEEKISKDDQWWGLNLSNDEKRERIIRVTKKINKKNL